MKDAGILLGRERKTEGFFWVPKKGLRDVFWGMLKNSDFGVDKFWSCDFFGYNIWASVGPPPPVMKFVSGAPGGVVHHLHLNYTQMISKMTAYELTQTLYAL